MVDVTSAFANRGQCVQKLFASVRQMFPLYLDLEASCLIAVTKLPSEGSARKSTFDDVSEVIRHGWNQDRSRSPPPPASFGKKLKTPDPPQIVAINPSEDPTKVLERLRKLPPILNASSLFVPNLEASDKIELFSVLNHVRDQVRTCLQNDHLSDVFSLIRLLDKFASFKLQEAVRVKNDAVQMIVAFVSELQNEILHLSRAGEW